jgi:hypothetical protein
MSDARDGEPRAAAVPVLPELQSRSHRGCVGDLGEIAHVKPLPSDRAFLKLIGFALSCALRVAAGVARKFAAHYHSSSGSRM